MCLLVIMCALALIRTGSGAVVMSGDNKVDIADNGTPGNDCFFECLPRCQKLLKTAVTRCCDCFYLCETSCNSSFRKTSNLQPEKSYAPSLLETPCDTSLCDLVDSTGRIPIVPRRSRRRPARSPMLREAAIIARSVGMDLGPLEAGSEKNDVGSAVGEGIQVIPRLVSLVAEEDTVTALVSWDSQAIRGPGQQSGTSWYLVAWEPEGGGVRGNVLTNSTSASLTLWPDTVYHIQVSATSSTAASSCLEVDTHSASAPPQLAQGTARGFLLSRVEGLSGVAAAVSLFLVILLISAVRCRYGLNLSSKHFDQSHQDCDRFKLYPPPVTLRHLAVGSGTTEQLPV